MVDTLQVDGLVRISGLTPALYKTHPQPPKDIPPRRIKNVAVGTLIILVDRNYELPANTSKLNKANLNKTRISQNHPGLCSTTVSSRWEQDFRAHSKSKQSKATHGYTHAHEGNVAQSHKSRLTPRGKAVRC